MKCVSECCARCGRCASGWLVVRCGKIGRQGALSLFTLCCVALSYDMAAQHNLAAIWDSWLHEFHSCSEDGDHMEWNPV